ncbi:hypothetical protein [Alkalinema sp. FACHB-956]|uniref:hypothetical protein n=1 Tax=Alkalinema sp. FACHB-956 TaxID=2692768 RepID=UPI0016890FB6|nr:hypothetical protein [Alkalinema sp. FACHB-956]MBD2326660.1 hypothetical protein [Alkalinema sp. FACHB-956]
MKITQLTIGLGCLSISVITGILVQAKPNLANADNAICQMTWANGRTQDLSQLCGKTTANPEVQPSIDLNAPSPVVLVGKDQPSELWNTIPDLQEPPKAGLTEAIAPAQD